MVPAMENITLEGRHYSARASDDYAHGDVMKPDPRPGGIGTAHDQIQKHLARLGEQISQLHEALAPVLRAPTMTAGLEDADPEAGGRSCHADDLMSIADRVAALADRVEHIRGVLDL